MCTAHEPAKKELHCGQIHTWHERGVLRWVKNHRTLTIEASDAQVAAHYAAMQRNASHLTDYFRLPAGSVVEIGRQVAI